MLGGRGRVRRGRWGWRLIEGREWRVVATKILRGMVVEN